MSLNDPQIGSLFADISAASSSRNRPDFMAAWQELEAMTGLANVKQQILRMVALARVAEVRKKRELPVAPISMHMVFAGPPGTGKTEVARKVGKIFHAAGLLKTSTVVEVDKSQLIAGYQGQTGQLVRNQIEAAKDGVLFLDEAYSLAGIKVGQPTPSPSSYEQDAIDTLLKGMEDFRDRIVVIAAGYTAEMRAFLQSNTGLKSRFASFIEFESYSQAELTQIFGDMVKRDRFTLADGAAKQLQEEMASLYDPRDPRFGNARAVRAFYERVQTFLALRLAPRDDLHSVDQSLLTTIQADDLAAAGLAR